MSHNRLPGLDIVDTQVAVGLLGFAQGGIGYVAVVMTGQEQRVVGQRAEFAQAVVHVLGIGAGKVPSAAAVNEKRITADQRVVNAEALAPGGMAGGVQEFDFNVAHSQRITRLDFNEVAVRDLGHFFDPLRLQFVDVEFHRIEFKQFAKALHVVTAEVSTHVVWVIVGAKGRLQLIALAVDMLNQAVDVPGWVNDCDFAAVPAADEVGKILHRPDLNLLDDQVAGFTPSAVAHFVSLRLMQVTLIQKRQPVKVWPAVDT